MTSNMKCPHCGSEDMVEMSETYHCRDCGGFVAWKVKELEG